MIHHDHSDRQTVENRGEVVRQPIRGEVAFFSSRLMDPQAPPENGISP
jgi:hypothetical protein